MLFHGKRHPADLGAAEVAAFVAWLATERRVSASTQNQALSAILFLYREVLGRELGALPAVPRARTPVRLPVVLSRGEVQRVLAELSGPVRLVAVLLYGAGLRLLECLQLRVKDLDLDRHEIIVRQGKGRKDRVTMLPVAARRDLERQLEFVRVQHVADLAAGFGGVVLPDALERKYPEAAKEWGWQFLFPAARICRDARWGPPTRFHLHESAVQRAVSEAVRRAGIAKRASCHTFRHHADSPIMPPALGDAQGRGGDRALPDTAVGIIRDVQETRGVDRAGGNGLASHRSASCARAPAL